MQAELNSDVALLAANELVTHLRKNPEAASQPAHVLATRFGLDEAFVAQVLQGIHLNKRPEVRPTSTGPSAFRSMTDSIRNLWLKATARPVVFVIVTFILSFLVTVLIFNYGPPAVIRVGPKSETPGMSSTSIVAGLGLLAVIGTTFMLHMAVYFRHRSARNALWGALFLFLSSVVSFGYQFSRHAVNRAQLSTNPFVLFLVGTMGMLVMALVYAGFGSLAAVLGGWTRIKLAERAEETMSRQDLLERYFELQSRLQDSALRQVSGQGPAIFSSPAIAWYRKNQFLANAVFGFGIQLISIICLNVSGITPGQLHGESDLNMWFFVLMFIGIATFLFHILQGYLSKSAWRAAVGSLCIALGSTLAHVLPISDSTRETIRSPEYLLTELVDVLMMAGVSCAGYLGAVVQNRAIRESNLQRNDQATVLAEMVRIQWKLANESATLCVMVVDAAKSSEMKADANPLEVEYTFREYQEWIELISTQHGGRVNSTAGDGAVVAFGTCEAALAAARRIQTDIFKFNKDVNRLSHPFRLRVGLHSGEVVGDINQVQFTEVIDIAAHIEAASPVGGIAVTDEVAQKLPDEDFIDLGVSVDGHQVFMVANPTEYR